MRLLFETRHECSCTLKRLAVVIDAEKQQQTVARCSIGGGHQRRMAVGGPLVQAEQHSAVRVDDLPEVTIRRSGRSLVEQRLVPREAGRYVSDTDDRPRAFHDRLQLEAPAYATLNDTAAPDAR